MSTPKKQEVSGASTAAPVPPAPSKNGEPASFAPKPNNVPAPDASDAVVVNGTGAISTKDVKAGIAQGKLSTEQPRTSSANRAPRPGPRESAPAPAPIGARRVRLAVTRVDPWSAMKMSFLLSIAAGIMMVVAAIVFWKVLDGLHVFTEIDQMVKEILGAETDVNILQYVELSRVVSLTTIIAIVDIVLLTALGTIGAFLYNVVASLVGGIHLTLTDD